MIIIHHLSFIPAIPFFLSFLYSIQYHFLSCRVLFLFTGLFVVSVLRTLTVHPTSPDYDYLSLKKRMHSNFNFTLYAGQGSCGLAVKVLPKKKPRHHTIYHHIIIWKLFSESSPFSSLQRYYHPCAVSFSFSFFLFPLQHWVHGSSRVQWWILALATRRSWRFVLRYFRWVGGVGTLVGNREKNSILCGFVGVVSSTPRS